MKKILDRLIAALCIASIATSAVAVKINAPGDINNFSPAVVSAMSGLYVSPSRQILTSSPLSGGGDLTADRTISLGTLGTAGTYGDATHTNVITTDAYGRISAITPTVITGVAASTAVTLATPRTIAIQTGDVTSPGASFDGSANETAATTLATVNANVGACGSATQSSVVTLNAKGLATACTSTVITNTTGNSATATALATSRTIAILTGDVTSPGAGFTGAANETAAATLATTQSGAHTWSAAQTVLNNTFTVDGGLSTFGRYAASGALVLRRADGTQASPTAVSSLETLATIVGRGYDGTAYQDGGNVSIISDGAITSSSSPGHIDFSTTPSGSTTSVSRMTIASTGSISIPGNVAIGRTTPSTTLDVNGNVSIADGSFSYTGYTGSTNTGTVRAGFQMDGTNQTLNFYTANTFRGNIDASGNLNINTNASRNSLLITDTGGNGAGIGLSGDGATTPKKYLRVNGGNFQIVNNAYGAVIWQMSDVGSTIFTGFIRPSMPTVSALATADPSPQAGDMLAVADAVTCVTNTTPTGGGSTTCPLVYSGAAWKAMVTH